MTIYFAGSIRGGRDDQEWYGGIIRILNTYGTVLTEHIDGAQLTSQGEKLDSRHIYERDLSWVLQADAVVAEVSTPSLGVGYEIGVASYARNKPVLCLYRQQAGRSLSAMVAGNPGVTNQTYQIIEDLPKVFDTFFSSIKQSKLVSA